MRYLPLYNFMSKMSHWLHFKVALPSISSLSKLWEKLLLTDCQGVGHCVLWFLYICIYIYLLYFGKEMSILYILFQLGLGEYLVVDTISLRLWCTPSALFLVRCFGIIHKMLDGNGHICLLFAELDEDQPVSNVVSYVRHLLSQHPSHHHHPHPHRRHWISFLFFVNVSALHGGVYVQCVRGSNNMHTPTVVFVHNEIVCFPFTKHT